MTTEAAFFHGQIYQLKIHLVGISPMIWRRLLVASETTIAQFHHILQVAMGWENFHLHRFTIHGKEYGIRYDGGIGFTDDPWQVRLGDFRLRVNDIFHYEYDFGDSWEHQIRVEEILERDPKKKYPRCIDGRRACPPEDSGGPWTYQVALHVLKRRWHPDRSLVRESLGRDFDPAVFRRGPVNRAFRRNEHEVGRPEERSF
ncbi:MAG: plasmid pRiA4b ORF-3 family protein [Deltaproteobacteria bacterium]|nr:plasmid pRiA4b ORF-3 family protein [Deltaproteobacteria bacterium]